MPTSITNKVNNSIPQSSSILPITPQKKCLKISPKIVSDRLSIRNDTNSLRILIKFTAKLLDSIPVLNRIIRCIFGPLNTEPQVPKQKTPAKNVHFDFEVKVLPYNKNEAPKNLKVSKAEFILLKDINHVPKRPKRIVAPANSIIQPAIPPAVIVPLQRKVPPLGICDTIVWSKSGGIKSIHGQGKLFADSEIMNVHKVIKKKDLGRGVMAEYSENNKAIIQQQATRGCTAATSAMLIADHGKNPDVLELMSRNLGDTSNQVDDIKRAGLKPLIIEIDNSENQLNTLRKLIQKNGSAIIGISGELGGHVIVVDDISSDFKTARIREPYHGWEITVTGEALKERFQGGTIIQIAK